MVHDNIINITFRMTFTLGMELGLSETGAQIEHVLCLHCQPSLATVYMA